MDIWYLIQSAVLGIVEGLTEFLPISSTGHLIIASEIINFSNTPGADTFIVGIQAGAILAVCWYYRERIKSILTGFFSSEKDRRLAVNTVAAFLPAAVIGLLVAKHIKTYLFNPFTVSIALVVGGLIILYIESLYKKGRLKTRVKTIDDMSIKDALLVGFMQCLAMIPGTSRSGSTIIGGLVLGLSRKAATEFSFFLSIPTIFGATAYDIYKSWGEIEVADPSGFIVGTIVSFISALIVIHWLLNYVSKNSFNAFGWYRIIFGLIILVLTGSGLVAWQDI